MSTTQQKYHTQMPNELMDILMSKAVNASMKSVLTLIARKTYGFHKETDEISLTQFEKNTGLTRPTIVGTLSKLQRAQLVLLISKGRSKISSNRWQLDLSNWEEKLVKLRELVKNDTFQLVKNPLHTKEKQNKFNNYLATSSSFKETNFGGEPQPLPKPQPEVIFRRNLKKVKTSLDSWLDKYPDSELDEGAISRNTEAAVKGILYYIRKYKVYCHVDHPLYKLPQLRDCLEGFLDGIWQVERCGIPLPLDEIITKVVDRWFETTSTNSNKLRLSVFVGQVSDVFPRALASVMADYGLEWKEGTDVDS